MKKTKEQIIDDEIVPLMTKVIEICRFSDISMVSSFCFEEGSMKEDGESTMISTFLGNKDRSQTPKAYIETKRAIYGD